MTTPAPIATSRDAPVVAWARVCRLDDLQPERGAAALVQGRQIALFRTWDDAVYAVDHLDPFSGAHVIARGIVGTRGAVPTVASPMHKQAFDLRTGDSLDDPTVHLQVHAVRLMNGMVEVALGGPITRAEPELGGSG
jgi:nitrite reductase (NADH) small subunit